MNRKVKYFQTFDEDLRTRNPWGAQYKKRNRINTLCRPYILFRRKQINYVKNVSFILLAIKEMRQGHNTIDKECSIKVSHFSIFKYHKLTKLQFVIKINLVHTYIFHVKYTSTLRPNPESEKQKIF